MFARAPTLAALPAAVPALLCSLDPARGAITARLFSRGRAEIDRDRRSFYGNDVRLAAAGERKSDDHGENCEARHRGILLAPKRYLRERSCAKPSTEQRYSDGPAASWSIYYRLLQDPSERVVLCLGANRQFLSRSSILASFHL
jgi:hypothetical protein